MNKEWDMLCRRLMDSTREIESYAAHGDIGKLVDAVRTRRAYLDQIMEDKSAEAVEKRRQIAAELQSMDQKASVSVRILTEKVRN
jgi:hypothetical protein